MDDANRCSICVEKDGDVLDTGALLSNSTINHVPVHWQMKQYKYFKPRLFIRILRFGESRYVSIVVKRIVIHVKVRQ